MKKRMIPLFLTLLLCGCHAGDRGITRLSTLVSPPEAALTCTQVRYDPQREIERLNNGAVQTYILPMEDVSGIRMVGKDILVFSGTDTATTLTLLQGDTLQVENERTLPFFLDPRDPSLQIQGNTVSYYDPCTRNLVVLDTALDSVGCFPLPEASLGIPIFSAGSNGIYYCTQNAIYAWDLESGRHRLLRHIQKPVDITGIHCDGAILQCRSQQEPDAATFFLSTDTGTMLHTRKGSIWLDTQGSQYYSILRQDSGTSRVFGTVGAKPEALFPQEPESSCIFLPRNHSALTVSTPVDGQVTLDHYDLGTGHRTASLTLPAEAAPLDADGSGGILYLLSRDSGYNSFVLYYWTPRPGFLQDPSVYTAPHYTSDAPDLEGLARCRAYAAALSEKHGLRILLWKDAVRAVPWDYDLEPEYSVDILMQELQSLDSCLSHYPKELLEQTAAHFSSLTLCLVRSITGTPESGNQDPATGIQFLQGSDAYVAVAAGPFSDRALYHELFHVMETHIYGNSIALDQWDSLNPRGFSYDYSYLRNKARQSGVYLLHDTRSFVDTYSMSFPREDRARIMEYAMMPGNRELFQAETLQRKLRTICTGIREAYGLKQDPGTFLWEQYLNVY